MILYIKFLWEESKNTLLKQTRNISFEQITLSIAEKHIVDVIEHPNQTKYEGQVYILVERNDYRGCCKTSVLQQQPMKNAVLQPVGRKTARACAKPTGFCNRLYIYVVPADIVGDKCYLKTIYPSRKYTGKYLGDKK